MDPLGPGPWEKLGTVDGVDLARKSIPGTRLFAVRGIGEIEAPISRVAAVIYDHRRWGEWVRSMLDAQLLKQISPTEKLVYQAFKMPLWVSDRDTVYRFSMFWRDGALVFEGFDASHADAPKSVGVRSKLIIGRWTLRMLDSGHTHLTVEVLMDPGGHLPTWLVNMVQRDYPADTLNQVRQQVRKPGVVGLRLPPK